MTDVYATLDNAAKFFKNRTHFNNSRFLIMCYKNTENAPNIDFNRIPRQNTHSHIILKLQSLNYYYDSMNNNVTIKPTISNHGNETAMIFQQICDAVITSYPINIFSVGRLFTKVIKIVDQHDRLLRYPSHCSKVFQESNALQQQQISHQPNATSVFFKRISDADITSIQYNSFQRVHVSRKLSKSLINMTNFYATLDIAAKFFKNRTRFNNSRFLIMCYKNTKNTPNIDFNRIPRQNTHSHIILKHQSPNYYYDSANINVTIKTTISNNRNEIAMIFNPLTT